MLVTRTRTGAVRMCGIPNKVLRNMTPAELTAELVRVDRDLQAWRRMSAGQPRWYRGIPQVKAERRVLVAERERVQRELKTRTVRAVEVEKAMTAEDAKAEMEV